MMAATPKASIGLLFLFWRFWLVVSERQLQRIVIIGRHSVKNPYPATDAALEPGVANSPISAYTSRPLPDFGVPPGHLTQQGRTLMRHLGAYDRAHYSEFLGHLSCSDVAIFADPLSRRDIDSAQEFAKGFDASQRCGYQVRGGGSSPAAERERLRRIFRDQPDVRDRARGCSTPSTAELAAILGVAETSSVPGLRLYKRQLALMQERTQCCQEQACGSGNPNGICTLYGLPTVLAPNVTWRAVGGALGAASAMAEIFAMQFCNGLEAGWGLNEEQIVELLALLEVPLLQAGVNDVTARNLGSELMSELLRVLSAESDGPKVAVYFGHDTNIHFLQKMLNLRWLSDGWWPNLAEPGAQLVFEVYKDSDGGSSVRVLKVGSSPTQQRLATPLTLAAPPSISPIWVPGCSGIFCSLPRVLAMGRAVMRLECIDGGSSSSAMASATQAASAVGVVEPEVPRADATDASKDANAGVGVVVPEVTPPPSSKDFAAASDTVVDAQAAAPGPSAPAAQPVPTAAPVSSGGPSFSTMFLIALCGMCCFAWRYKRKKEAASRGYEILGGSHML